MNAVVFLASWALRSSLLIACGALWIAMLKGRAASTRLMAWTAILAGSLALPGLNVFVPGIAVPMAKVPSALAGQTRSIMVADSLAAAAGHPIHPVKGEDVRKRAAPVAPFDWTRAALALYAAVTLVLMLRICVGLAAGVRLRRASRGTSPAVRESDSVTVPLTIGIFRPAIVLPPEWSEWPKEKLEAALAHEESHIRRRDPVVLLAAAVHRAILWFSPLSWYLHRQMVRTAEEASDDAAVAAIQDRALYAEILLGFMRRAADDQHSTGLAMARYDLPEKRIHRILDAPEFARGMTRWGVAAILGLAGSLTYVAAAFRPEATPSVSSPPVVTWISAPLAAPPPAPVILTAQASLPSAAKPSESNSAVVVMAIDRSASMEKDEKMELARAAAIGVVEDLRTSDRVGVLTFNQLFDWAVPIRRADDKPAVTQLINGLYPDGGTKIPEALAEAYNKVLPFDGKYRHIVLLTDGISEEAGAVEVASEAASQKITISTIGLGPDVKRDFLEKIAQSAEGKSYFLTEPTGLRQIMLKDVQEFTGRSRETGSNNTPYYDRNADPTQKIKVPLYDGHQAGLSRKP